MTLPPELPPIPTPPAIRWREFRLRALPAVVFAAAIVIAAVIWDRAVAPPTLVAEAELIQTDVRLVQTGTLAALEVELMQPVAAGAVIGRLLPADPKVLAASLAVIEAEVALLRTSLEPALASRRVALEHERLQLEWMHERVELVALRAQLVEAEASLARLTPLHEGQILAEQAYATAQHLRDGLVAQIGEQTRLVEQLQPALQSPDAGGGELPLASTEDTMAAAIRVQERKLRLTEVQLGPVELRAPISGVVVLMHHRAGEAVAAGEPVVTIAAERPVRLIGFLRQPLGREPRAGQPVEIRTRAMPRRIGHSTVEQVGSALEPVSPTLQTLLNRPGLTELGLRVHIRLPVDLSLHPGECVDVILGDDES